MPLKSLVPSTLEYGESAGTVLIEVVCCCPPTPHKSPPLRLDVSRGLSKQTHAARESVCLALWSMQSLRELCDRVCVLLDLGSVLPGEVSKMGRLALANPRADVTLINVTSMELLEEGCVVPGTDICLLPAPHP
jgi:hypothetical protein